jgi:hypothetical protein
MRIALAVVVAGLCCLTARAEDWNSTDGKTYKNVKVITHNETSVTVDDDAGGDIIPLASLPKDLQKRFNYDPAKAKAAADERAKQEKEAELKAAQAEREEQAAQDHAKLLDQLEQNSMQIRLRISQKVHDNSALVDYDTWGDRTVDAKGGVAMGWWPNGRQILVIGIPSDSVDGDPWEGKVYYAGIYKGEGQTLRQWATTKEEALRLLKKSSSTPADADGPRVPSQ